MTVRAPGFSLIELLVVVVIVGVLSAIAIPSYTHYLTDVRRASAEACLSDYANFMARTQATSQSYAGATLPALDCASADQTGAYYQYSLANLTAGTFTLQGTAIGTQADADAACSPLTLDQTGSQGPAGCWKQ